jgi:guanosine-3',5'-bis(diphosphate) 3'-pyrophosphohydrolase
MTNKGEMLGKMLVLVANRHAGQFDRAGVPYALHVLKVMHYTKTDDEELNCIALGHDLVEDTDTTYQELYDMGFTARVIHGIDALTKRRGESYDDYKSRVKANVDARKVKKADLRHNSDLRRLKGITEKDLARSEKYHRFYAELEILDREGNTND